MLQLVQVTPDEQLSHVHQLFSEYVQLLHEISSKEYGVPLDIDAALQMFMAGIDAFYPPGAKMYLSKYNGEFAGIGCLQPLSDQIGEIKRMYVQPRYLRKGIGRAILNQLVDDARSIAPVFSAG